MSSPQHNPDHVGRRVSILTPPAAHEQIEIKIALRYQGLEYCHH